MSCAGIKDVSRWSERMRDPFVKVYGMDYFQRQWSKWVKAYGRYLEERNGNEQKFCVFILLKDVMVQSPLIIFVNVSCFTLLWYVSLYHCLCLLSALLCDILTLDHHCNSSCCMCAEFVIRIYILSHILSTEIDADGLLMVSGITWWISLYINAVFCRMTLLSALNYICEC